MRMAIVGNVCDNCATTENPLQEDSDDNGIGDACKADIDTDDDGVVIHDSAVRSPTLTKQMGMVWGQRDNCATEANQVEDTDNDGTAMLVKEQVQTEMPMVRMIKLRRHSKSRANRQRYRWFW